MRGKSIGGDDERQPVDDGRPGEWYRPLGSVTAARRLADLVHDRSGTLAPPGLSIDVDGGVASSNDRRWSASLAPLAARVAAVDPSGWAAVVDHEIACWHRAAATVGGHRTSANSGSATDSVNTVIRLTDERTALGATLRPAFGPVTWELVHDLGPDGLAAVRPAPAEQPTVVSEQTWRRVASQTVVRYQDRWTTLTLEPASGLVLSGPLISALLFDPENLVAAIADAGSKTIRRVTVFTNALLLLTPGEPTAHSDVGLVAESLGRYTSVSGRRFEPFSFTVEGIGRSRPPD